MIGGAGAPDAKAVLVALKDAVLDLEELAEKANRASDRARKLLMEFEIEYEDFLTRAKLGGS